MRQSIRGRLWAESRECYSQHNESSDAETNLFIQSEKCNAETGSYRDFAKFGSTTPKSLDPEDSNVLIHSDDTMAAVYFDFAFKIDGMAENRCSEFWQLLNTVGGLRIVGIIYSSDPAVQQ